MAIDDDSFYNIVGEEISRGNLVQEMIDFYALKLEVGETQITDFNEGSEIRNLLEAFAVDLYVLMEDQNELSKIGFIDTAEGEWLDKHGANPLIRLDRDTGTEATGYVTFSIPEPAVSEILIPEGTTVVCEETGLEYATDNEAIIGVNEKSVLAVVTCLPDGEDGNCAAGLINTIIDDYINIEGLTVTNENPLSGGTEYEEDEEYRERLLDYVRRDDFGSIGYYTDLGNSVDGVHDVYLIDDVTYTKKVLVNGVVKPTPESVLIDVLSAYTASENIVINHSFTVDTPTYVSVDLVVNLDVAVELSEDDINNLLTDLFNGGSSLDSVEYEGLSIGETLTKSALYSALEMLDNVENVYVEYDNAEFSDLSPSVDEILVLGDVSIVQNVVE